MRKRSKVFLISAGPTREFLDPVRFLSSPSSGKMGIALARAACRLGHAVYLVHGPCSERIPRNTRIRPIAVTSALEMRSSLLKYFSRADIVVMAAAVSDFRPQRCSAHKIKKSAAGAGVLKLVRNPDILAELGRKRTHQILVGFAAETRSLLRHARGKLHAKNLNCIVVNKVGGKNGAFGSPSNKTTVVFKNGKILSIPRQAKMRLAPRLIRLFLSLQPR